jgi:hypothetical protein
MFLDDGRVELDNNIVERSIRRITLNRKNALFAGSDGGAEPGFSSLCTAPIGSTSFLGQPARIRSGGAKSRRHHQTTCLRRRRLRHRATADARRPRAVNVP